MQLVTPRKYGREVLHSRGMGGGGTPGPAALTTEDERMLKGEEWRRLMKENNGAWRHPRGLAALISTPVKSKKNRRAAAHHCLFTLAQPSKQALIRQAGQRGAPTTDNKL